MISGFVSLLILDYQKEWVLNFAFGLLFGFGLLISGMCRISKIQGFLVVNEHWDPTLMFVMASAVGINLFTFNYILK